MIRGIGIDVVELPRLRKTIDTWGDRFLNKVFTDAELGYARTKKDPVPHIAGRFAVKEAVAKAMATGWSGSFRWKDVEVTNDSSGKPSVLLSGGVRTTLLDCVVHVTISHSETVVVAAAVIESSG
jgi:holo-[acyl-carrier protein] synthase